MKNFILEKENLIVYLHCFTIKIWTIKVLTIKISVLFDHDNCFLELFIPKIKC